MVTEQESEQQEEKPTFNIEPGDLGGLMAEYPHIRQWVEAVSYTHLTLPTTPYV